MMVIKTADLTQNFKKIADSIYKEGERVLISRPHNENIVMITEREYASLEKARRNVEYMQKIDGSIKALERGEGISFTIDELEAIEDMRQKDDDK
jgi:antitoxin YefM